MSDYKLVPVELTDEMIEASGCEGTFRVNPRVQAQEMWEAMLAAAPTAPAVQGEPVGWQFYQDGKWWHGDDRIKDHRKNTEEAGYLIRDVYAAPQPAEQQPAPDVPGLVEALESALFGTPLDDVSNRDNDDIWCLCYPHLPERASDVLRDHLVRIETALAAYRKGGEV